jgi:diadenosine tetraphosphate (Ap4A) HIT family hydrolase
MASAFSLHPRLAADTAFVADWDLSRVLVMNDCRYPWLILVPRRDGVTEVFDLEPSDRAVMIEEIARAGAALKRLTGATKLNVGALGNVVSQLHVHLVARNPGDAAWPGPVWGHGVAHPYEPLALAAFVARLLSAL